MSLRTLDLSANNLCNCSPKYATASHSTWSGDAIEVLAESLLTSSVQVLNLSENELSGLWNERLGGDWATQGTYTTQAVDALIVALEKERLQIKKRGGLNVEQNNFLKHDWVRLERAILENEKKPKRAFGASGIGSTSKAKKEVKSPSPVKTENKRRASVSSRFTPAAKAISPRKCASSYW